MKKSLFISALVAFVMMFCVNVNAQEKATGKAYKDLKKQEKDFASFLAELNELAKKPRNWKKKVLRLR